MATLSEILTAVNSYVDLEAAEPTGSELTLRTNYANQAVREWASAYQWPELTQVYTTFASGATISLPSTFREFLSAPRDINQNVYIQIAPEERQKRDVSEMYVPYRQCYVWIYCYIQSIYWRNTLNDISALCLRICHTH